MKKTMRSIVLLIVAVILLACAFGGGYAAAVYLPIPGLGSTVDQPGSIIDGGDAGTPADLESLFTSFWEAWDIIHEQYYQQPLDDASLVDGAIRGMMDALPDDHSLYMDPQETSDFYADMTGEYDGIGAYVDTQAEFLTIIRPIPGFPAEEAGLLPGDQIIAVDGEDVVGVDAALVRLKVLGPEGSTVVLTIIREGVDEPFDVPVTRAHIVIPSVEGEMLEGGIAHITISVFGDTTGSEFHTILEDLLAHPRKILALIQEDLRELSDQYGDERRTHIAGEIVEDLSEANLIPDEAVLISLTSRGYVKRVAAKAYRSQGIGKKGVSGHATKEEDEVVSLIPARSLDTMLFFSDHGKVYSEKVYQIPGADRAAKGIPLVNVLSLEAGEIITAAVPVPNFEAAEYITLATRNGKVKRMTLSDLSSVRPSGIIGIGLDEGDELGWARLTHAGDEIIMVSEGGQALRFAVDKVRASGRAAGGVAGMKLSGRDKVASMEVIEPDGYLVLVTAQGFGKRTPLAEYPVKGRATGGVATISKAALEKTGLISAARVVQEADDLTLISANGMVLRMKVSEVREAGRATRGVRLMEIKEGDKLASLARIAVAELDKAGASITESGTTGNKQQYELPIK